MSPDMLAVWFSFGVWYWMVLCMIWLEAERLSNEMRGKTIVQSWDEDESEEEWGGSGVLSSF